MSNVVEILDYYDCFTVTVDGEEFIFDGISEPEKMFNLLKKLGIGKLLQDEIARDRKT